MLPRCHRYQISRHCIQFTGMYDFILWIVAYLICYMYYVNQNCLTLTCTYMMSESGEIQAFELVCFHFNRYLSHSCCNLTKNVYTSFTIIPSAHKGLLSPMIGEMAVFSCGIWQVWNFEMKIRNKRQLPTSRFTGRALQR